MFVSNMGIKKLCIKNVVSDFQFLWFIRSIGSKYVDRATTRGIQSELVKLETKM